MQIGAELLCKGANVRYESIEYGVLSIGAHDEDTRPGGHVGQREAKIPCKSANAAEPRAKVQM